MKEIMVSMLAGVVIGALFKWLKLPIPSPSAFSGIVGIIGIFVGSKVVDWFMALSK